MRMEILVVAYNLHVFDLIAFISVAFILTRSGVQLGNFTLSVYILMRMECRFSARIRSLLRGKFT